MASNSSVVVLTPNGRRVTVKVNPNTSILQVLEDACRKHGFNATEYDLKHYNRIVEPTNAFRFSGLPNNATLEMVPSSRPRQETTINLGLQIESGKRLMHQFPSSNTLWEVIKHWEAAGESVRPVTEMSDTVSVQPVCVYMRQEVVGQLQLESRTLRSLGLTHGSACIRLLYRNTEQLGFQANVSGPLTRPSTVRVDDEEPLTPDPPPAPDQPNASHGGAAPPRAPEANAGGKKRQLSPVPMDMDDDTGPTVVAMETPSFPLDLSSNNAAPPAPPAPLKPRISKPGDFHLLGEHHALLYHLDDVSQPSTTSVPDSFFDLTRGDLEVIYRDLKTKREQLENAPLYTATLRDQQREEAIQRNLTQHPVTVVRIRFQNRYVLQAVFRGDDSVGSVMNMVKSHLANDQTAFYLFTSPPKVILDPDQRLVEAALVGSAVVYFGSEESADNYLKMDVYQKVSCPDAAAEYIQNLDFQREPVAANGSRPVSQGQDSCGSSAPSGTTPAPDNSAARNAAQHNARPQPSRGVETDRVPKWFKRP